MGKVDRDWTLPGTFVNTNSDPNCDLFYDKNPSLLVRSSAANGTLSTFCWYVSGEQPATASVTVYLYFNSRPAPFPYTATGQFNVHRPTTAEGQPYQPDGTPKAQILDGTLSLGVTGVTNDMSFKHTITTDGFSAGQAGYVQLIISADWWSDPIPTLPRCPALDNRLGKFPRGTPNIPANTNTSVWFCDAPNIGLQTSGAPSWEDVSFSTYLMFKPTGGIWVPLRLITWEVHDESTHNGGQWAAINSHNNETSKITDDKETIAFPRWTTTYP